MVLFNTWPGTPPLSNTCNTRADTRSLQYLYLFSNLKHEFKSILPNKILIFSSEKFVCKMISIICKKIIKKLLSDTYIYICYNAEIWHSDALLCNLESRGGLEYHRHIESKMAAKLVCALKLLLRFKTGYLILNKSLSHTQHEHYTGILKKLSHNDTSLYISYKNTFYIGVQLHTQEPLLIRKTVSNFKNLHSSKFAILKMASSNARYDNVDNVDNVSDTLSSSSEISEDEIDLSSCEDYCEEIGGWGNGEETVDCVVRVPYDPKVRRKTIQMAEKFQPVSSDLTLKERKEARSLRSVDLSDADIGDRP
ncbi:hypothetical protein GQR58_002715 [Nymphon striatum]|nr:hypothetical protein GQR58_002715 [Nymphon striatum]